MKTFPCPYCTRLGEPSVEPGERGDYGVQIGPNFPCGACDGTGFVEVGSEKHFEIKCNSAGNAICKIFGESIEDLPEKEFKQFWRSFDFDILKETWLKNNKQEFESEVKKDELYDSKRSCRPERQRRLSGQSADDGQCRRF